MSDAPRLSLSKLQKTRKRFEDLFLLDDPRLLGQNLGSLEVRDEMRNTLLRVFFPEGVRELEAEETAPLPSAEFAAETRELLQRQAAALDTWLMEHRGTVLEYDGICRLAKLFAGLHGFFRRGEVPDMYGLEPVWGAFYVDSVMRIPGRDGKVVCAVSIRGIAGAPTGITIEKTLSEGAIRVLLPHLGAAKYGKYSWWDIGGLHFTARVFGKERDLEFSDYFLSSSQSTWNKDLLKARKGPCEGPLRGNRKACGACPLGRGECSQAHLAAPFGRREDVCQRCGEEGRIDREGHCFACHVLGKIRKEFKPI